MNTTEKEFDDFITFVGRQLKHYAKMLATEKHHNMFHDLQRLTAENLELKKKLKENDIIWEK